MTKRKVKLSKISLYHYAKLVFHSLMFLTVLVLYIVNRVQGNHTIENSNQFTWVFLFMMWLVFMIEMIFRFRPADIESMGCQKVFKKNYSPVSEKRNIKPQHQSWKRTFWVAFVWICFNAVFGVLFYLNVIDEGFLILLSLAYSVCDMICILFFCPFQTWFMKNKCCNTCRIYDWDYIMMTTPLVFIPNILTWTLVGAALALLIKWEIIYKKHPERFAENTNKNLKCANCKEKLCVHKKQLQAYLLKFREFYEQKLIPYFSKETQEDVEKLETASANGEASAISVLSENVEKDKTNLKNDDLEEKEIQNESFDKQTDNTEK